MLKNNQDRSCVAVDVSWDLDHNGSPGTRQPVSQSVSQEKG